MANTAHFPTLFNANNEFTNPRALLDAGHINFREWMGIESNIFRAIDKERINGRSNAEVARIVHRNCGLPRFFVRCRLATM